MRKTSESLAPVGRRGLLGSLAALAAAPFAFGRSLTARWTRHVVETPAAEAHPHVLPPTHSVKRRG